MPQALRRSGSGSDAGAPLCRALEEEDHGGRHRHAPESGFRRRQGVSGIRPRLRYPVHRLHRAHHAPRDADARADARAGCSLTFFSWNTSCVSGFPHACRKSFLQALPAGSVSPLPLRGARRSCPEGMASFLPSGVFGEGESPSFSPPPRGAGGRVPLREKGNFPPSRSLFASLSVNKKGIKGGGLILSVREV